MGANILATLGPSSLKKDIVRELADNNVSLFRINLSHTPLKDVAGVISRIQSWTDVPVCLDSEGAQLRNQDMVSESVVFRQGETVVIHHDSFVGDGNNISFVPMGCCSQFQVGDHLRVDFDSVLMRITEAREGRHIAKVVHGGVVGSNKAADIDRRMDLDPVTKKDREAFEIGLGLGVKNFSLSFTNRESDVHEVRRIIGEESNLICKIESVEGVLNLNSILSVADEILIDRGDLSREIPIEKIPFIQRMIISSAKTVGVPVNVATNLLESMIKFRLPTRAEANDVASTLIMGADGLVLAAETAIGKYPVGAVKMVNSIIEEYDRWTPQVSYKDMIG